MKITLEEMEEQLIDLCEDNEIMIKAIKRYFMAINDKETETIELDMNYLIKGE